MTDSAATLLVGALAAVLAIWGIYSQRSIARCHATLDFIARSESDSDLIEARRLFNDLARTPSTMLAIASQYGTPDAQKVRLVLNEFELIAIGIQRRIIDLELYRRWFGSGTILSWNYAEPMILELRRLNRNRLLYHEFEQLVGWLNEPLPKRRKFWINLP